MNSILYLHGLDSVPDHEKQNYLSTQANIILSPQINYREGNGFKIISDIVENNNPSMVIGSSMGGLMGYHIGRKYGVPSICFNPALAYKNSPYSSLITIDDYKPLDADVVLILGGKDTIVPIQSVLDNVQQAHVKIIYVPEMEHRISLDNFKLIEKGIGMMNKR